MKTQKEFLHIFAFQNIYCEYFQKFVEDKMDAARHQFVYLHKDGLSFFEKIRYWKSLRPQLEQAPKIIIHFLPTSTDLFFWMLHQSCLTKSIWCMWGRDVFYRKVRKAGVNKWIVESMRKHLIPKIDLITGHPSDYTFLKDCYPVSSKFELSFYPLPGFNLEEEVVFEQKSTPVQVLLGNSADPSNRHILTLELLAKFKEEEILILCPLSYGGNQAYIDRVCQAGQAIFGEKFKPLLEFLPIGTYNEILKKTDITLMNHERQQGLGNIRSLLFQGKKIFMANEQTPFTFYTQELGFHIEDAQGIDSMDFEEFSNMPLSAKRKNHELYKKHFGDENILQLWKNLFNA